MFFILFDIRLGFVEKGVSFETMIYFTGFLGFYYKSWRKSKRSYKRCIYFAVLPISNW